MTTSTPPSPAPPHNVFRQNLKEWTSKSVVLLREARLQQEEGEQAIENAREQMPKVSQSVKTLKMYLDYLKLATRQIELVRDFGLGALKTTTMVGTGGAGGGGAKNHGSGGDGGGGRGGVAGYNIVQAVGSGCGIEVS